MFCLFIVLSFFLFCLCISSPVNSVIYGLLGFDALQYFCINSTIITGFPNSGVSCVLYLDSVSRSSRRGRAPFLPFSESSYILFCSPFSLLYPSMPGIAYPLSRLQSVPSRCLGPKRMTHAALYIPSEYVTIASGRK